MTARPPRCFWRDATGAISGRSVSAVDRPLLVSIMPPVLTVFGFLAWPLAIGVAVAVFGTSSNAALSLLSHSLSASASATIKAGVPAPVIRMPSTPVVSPEAAHAKVAALLSGRDYAVARASIAPPQGSGSATMAASIGLVIRSQPKKTSAALGTLAKGASVEVKSKQGGWMLVETGDGVTGWVFGKYLTASSRTAGT